jgi:hypothetical protein
MGRFLLCDDDIVAFWSLALSSRPEWMRGSGTYEGDIKSPEEQDAELGLLIGVDVEKD